MTMVVSELTRRLCVWKPELTDDEIVASREALRHGASRYAAENGNRCPTMHQTIWWLMCEATKTWRLVPDRERAWHMYKVMWPDLARPSEDNRKIEDQIENETSILGGSVARPDGSIVIRDGLENTVRLTITDPTAVDRAMTVYSWFKFVRAKNRRETLSAFLTLAGGRGSRRAAMELGDNRTDYAVGKMKYRILGQIEAGLTKCLDVSRDIMYK